MRQHVNPTAAELSRAYRSARLRCIGVTLHSALTDPLIYRSLCLQVQAQRKRDLIDTPRQDASQMEAA